MRQGDGSLHKLSRTGIPLGIFEEQSWESAKASLAPGELLLCYTDGVPDAQNTEGEFFGEGRLLRAIRSRAGEPPHQLQAGILADIAGYTDHADQFDDIALVLLQRDAAPPM